MLKLLFANIFLYQSYNIVTKSDAGWGIFFNILDAKAKQAPCKKIIAVDPKYTSQICSGCGEIVKKSLAVRTHRCPYCGLEIDRDVNAAINILNRGIA